MKEMHMRSWHLADYCHSNGATHAADLNSVHRCAGSERPWWHLSPVSSAREELPLSDAPAQLLQPGTGDIEDSPGFSERETVEAPPPPMSSPAPAKKKGEIHRTFVRILDHSRPVMAKRWGSVQLRDASAATASTNLLTCEVWLMLCSPEGAHSPGRAADDDRVRR